MAAFELEFTFSRSRDASGEVGADDEAYMRDACNCTACCCEGKLESESTLCDRLCKLGVARKCSESAPLAGSFCDEFEEDDELDDAVSALEVKACCGVEAASRAEDGLSMFAGDAGAE